MTNIEEEYIFITKKQIYCNNENNYAVYIGKKVTDKENIEIKITGNTGQLILNNRYLVKSIPQLNKYGVSYKVTSISEYNQLVTEKDKISYLKLLGCTNNQAINIIETYPNFIENCIDNIEMQSIKHMKKEKFQELIFKITEAKLMPLLLVELSEFGLSKVILKQLLIKYPNVKILKEKLYENPYILADIKGYGFLKADKIALKINNKLAKSNFRIYAAIKYIITSTANQHGTTLLSNKYIIETLFSIALITENEYKNFISNKDNIEDFIIDDNFITLKSYYEIENNILQCLNNIENATNNIKPITLIDDIIEKFKTEKDIILSDDQISIMKASIDHNVLIITGNAGTGKSTSIALLSELYGNTNVYAQTLSAKAALRIKEIVNISSTTIHRRLSLRDDNNDVLFELQAGVAIIDEASMLNMQLFNCFIKNIPMGNKLIIIFDNGQLPPIGAGNVAFDLLNSDFKHIHLTKIYRQAQKSGIIMDAHKIRESIYPFEDKMVNTIHGELNDLQYFFNDDNEKLHEEVLKEYFNSIEEYGVDNVYIIVPRKNNCINSTINFNKIINDKLNPSDKYILSNGYKFKLNSKVIQRKNNYVKNIINGEIGIITELNSDFNYFIAKFYDYTINEDKYILYNHENFKEIELAYSLTVHSFQGSQIAKAIVVIDTTSWIMLDNCLLYTAMTRAKKNCSIFANRKAFYKALNTNKVILRRTNLNKIINEIKRKNVN